MKKFFLGTFCLLSLNLIKAQSIHLGLKAGPNLGKLSGQSFKDGMEWGYQLGGWVELDLSDKIGIQPEVLFSQTNTKTLTSADAQLGNLIKPDFKAKLNYLSIPVLLRINASDLITFHVGPQFSILTNKDESITTNGQNAFKNGDLAAVAGLQLNLNKLRIYGRYVVGITKVNDVVSQEKWRTQNIQFGVGFKLL